MSKISIITPAYNASNYLAETIASVQAQTFSDWEMIIVDDCSTDNTCEIASSYSMDDKRIKMIKHEKNSGVASARNTALDIATGEFIAFIDSDDLWMPEKLAKQLRFMEENGYALTYTKYQRFQNDSKQFGKVINIPRQMTASSIYGNTSIGCLTVMVNRRLVGEFHMPLIQHTEDNCTWQEILSRGYTAYGLNENLALYREGNASLTKNKKKAAVQQWSTYREYYKFSVLKSTFYFTLYVFNAVKKRFFG